MSLIRPSPALVVNSDTSIAESVRKMRENGVGSLLILRTSVPHDIMGIFTERDLLHSVEEIQQGGHWQQSITMVMKKDVYTVSIYDLNLAPEIMVKYNIRHLPVVYEGSDSIIHLAGMISMKDLFQQFVEKSQRPLIESPAHVPEIGLVCNDEPAKQVLISVLKQGNKAVLHELAMTAPPGALDVLVVDIDFHSAVEWSTYLRQLNANPACPSLIILFSPGLHEPKNVKLIHQLYDSPSDSPASAKKTAVFAKPINIFGLLQQLHSGF